MKALKEKNGNPMHLGKHVREVQVDKAQTWSQSAPQRYVDKSKTLHPLLGPKTLCGQVQNISPIVRPFWPPKKTCIMFTVIYKSPITFK